MRWVKIFIIIMAIAAIALANTKSAPQDRFVWIYGWPMQNDNDVREIVGTLETASKSGLNGAVLSARLDNLDRQSPQYFPRLKNVMQACERNGLELIPAGFSVGYGSAVLAHDRNLAEGFPVVDAPFVVKDSQARLVPDSAVQIANGGFEEFYGSRFKRFVFHDEPGVISFPDTRTVHSGGASIRFENFKSSASGNARIMQEIKVHPRRCYRVSIWVKTEGLNPPDFQIVALKDKRTFAPRRFTLPQTAGWRRITTAFNSLDFDRVSLYAGVWGAREGKFWLDDWAIEEIGPLNVLRRPGTPVTVKSGDGSAAYEEGKDFAPLEDPNFSFSNVEHEAPPLKILPRGRIHEGDRLRVSWFHPMAVNESQVSVCMAEPKVYEIFEQEAKLIWETLHPKRFLLNMDEVRMGGSCNACRGKNIAELLGECITKQVSIIRRLNPKAEIYIWSDMLDPNQNAHGDYYLVEGDFTGSWNYVPKDLIIAVWGGQPREKSLRFFTEHGFRMLVACYYDADTLDEVKGWLQLARGNPSVRGFMYTTWERNYKLLADFGGLLKNE